MPLTLYIDELDVYANKVVKFSDAYFGMQMDKLVVDSVIKDLIHIIDGSEYISDTTIKTRYGNYLDMSYLSTGCKTAINVYTNSNLLFDCTESGTNAVVEMLKLHQGNILVRFLPVFTEDFAINVNLVYQGDRRHYTSFSDLLNTWYRIGG